MPLPSRSRRVLPTTSSATVLPVRSRSVISVDLPDARIVEVEPAEQFGPRRFRLDQLEFGETEQELPDLRRGCRVIAFLDQHPASADRGEVGPRLGARHPHPGEVSEAGGKFGEGALAACGEGYGALSARQNVCRRRGQQDRGTQQQEKTALSHRLGPSRERCAAAPPAPQAQCSDDNRRRGYEHRHQRDVAEFEDQFEPLDILTQCRLDAAQLTPRRDHVGTELVHRLGLLRVSVALASPP